MIKNGSNIEVINLTNQLIKLYPQDTVDISTNPVMNLDKAKFFARCIDIPSVGHAKCELHRESDSYKVSIKGSSKKLALSFTNIGGVNNLPEEKDNVIIVVSQLVFNAIHNIRKDVYMVDKPIRDEAGKVIACRSFSRCVYDLQIKELIPIFNYLQSEIPNASDTKREKLVELNARLTNFMNKE